MGSSHSPSVENDGLSEMSVGDSVASRENSLDPLSWLKHQYACIDAKFRLNDQQPLDSDNSKD